MVCPMRRLLLLLMLSGLFFTLAQPALAQRRGSVPNVKIGLNRQLLSGYTYSLEEDATGTSVSNADGMQGNEIFAEYIFFEMISLELGYGLTTLARSYDLEDSGTKISTVNESVSTVLVGSNLYFNGSSGTGLKYFLGLDTGIYTVAHDFSGGTLGEETSSIPVAVNTIKLGVDWLMTNAGFRFQYLNVTGEDSDTSAISGYTQNFVFESGVATIGVLAFF